MQSPGPYLPCCHCGESFVWIYNESCPKCNTDTEFTLDAYYTQQRIVEAQRAEHQYGIDPDDDSEYEEHLYKLYSM